MLGICRRVFTGPLSSGKPCLQEDQAPVSDGPLFQPSDGHKGVPHEASAAVFPMGGQEHHAL